MTDEDIIARINTSEFRFSTSRSSGPGGQNVNKVNTRVELRFNIPSSSSFSDEEKAIITDKLKNRINNEGDLLIVSQSERTQLRNKEKTQEKLYHLLAKALTVKPVRKPTRPTLASKARRVDEKKKRGLIKSLRKDTGI
ncbi:MAG TPA: alternative ribosome rescue aminoacyl-tRNA hydrolase ArfB [Bacteroidales bacterium]|nr:alternative ribosome rescue aminoacyl-tRNA hydrolase ArfB [Bacteroidales bacterium]